MITQHFVRVCDGLASLREPALSGSRYSGGHGGCGAAAREGSESVRRATKLRRGLPEGASEREMEEEPEGGLIRG